MKKEIYLTVPVLLAIILFSFKYIQVFEPGYEDVGLIKQSLLRPAQFSKTQKGIWVLLNGQELDPKSELFELLTQTSDQNILKKVGDKYYLPNALGRFIRSSNFNGMGEDPEKNRLVGSEQTDDFKSHTHNYTSSARKSVSGKGSKSDYAWDGAGYTTAATGGDETRPKNISMYTYIKIGK
jgi:hypothetical protein